MSSISRSIWFDSQPSPTSSTPPALGCDASAARIARVPSRSSPSCEQPKGWVKAWTPSTRSEEHTSELQSLMRISYAVFRLKKKKQLNKNNKRYISILPILQCYSIYTPYHTY